jgi:hypothetical protein
MKYLDRLGIPVLGDLFREQVLLQLSVEEVGDKLPDSGFVQSGGLCRCKL